MPSSNDSHHGQSMQPAVTVQYGGFSEEDESEERQAALSSPIKGRRILSSSVSSGSVLFRTELIFIHRTWSRLKSRNIKAERKSIQTQIYLQVLRITGEPLSLPGTICILVLATTFGQSTMMWQLFYCKRFGTLSTALEFLIPLYLLGR